MPTIINADTATGGAIITGDTSGQLQLQSGGVTALTTTGANVAVAGTLTAAGGVTGVNLSASVTGTLSVANGGTGATTLTANNVLLGNGTSALQAVAPGTTGNILTSNGTTWTSATAPAGGFSNTVIFTSSGTWSIPAGITKCRVTVTGAGGGQNGGAASNRTGGGAGAGGTVIAVLNLTGSTASITIGTSSSGSSGGDSSFTNGSITITSFGGTLSSPPFNGGGGSNGNSGSVTGTVISSLIINGGDGQRAFDNATLQLAPNGGGSFWAGPSNSRSAPSTSYGVGASGSWGSNAYAGGPGVVMIEF